MQWPEKYYIYCDQPRFLYIPIEKAACTSLKSWIIALTCGEAVAKSSDANHFAREKLELHQYPSADAEKILADRSLFRFTFVRNPWDRLVSGFVHKFVPNKSPAQKFCREVERRRAWQGWLHMLSAGWLGEKAATTDLNSDLTFRQFVAELGNFRPSDYDPHWRPQDLFLGNSSVDFVGRFERLSDDFAELQRKLSAGGSLPQINETPRGQATTECLADWSLAQLRTLPRFPSYQQFYTPDLVDRVADIYTNDVRRFGYEFAPGKSKPASARAA